MTFFLEAISSLWKKTNCKLWYKGVRIYILQLPEHLNLLSSSILAVIPLGCARFCIGIYYKIKKSNIFLQWQPTSLLRLLIILGDESFLWKISVADARIFIWRRIPAYSKDKFRLKLLVISRIVKENLYSNDSYMISKRTFIQFQDTDFLLLQSKIISIHIM